MFKSALPTRHAAQAPQAPQARHGRRGLSHTVFQSDPPSGDLTWNDVWNAYEVCHHCHDDKSKNDCYAVYGVNGPNTERYIEFVRALRSLYEEMCHEERRKRSTHLHIGRLHLYVSWD